MSGEDIEEREERSERREEKHSTSEQSRAQHSRGEQSRGEHSREHNRAEQSISQTRPGAAGAAAALRVRRQPTRRLAERRVVSSE